MPTQVIGGRYELLEKLSAGGMGQIWRGYDTVLDREVAVKLIRPDVITSQQQAHELEKRFRREARVTARIDYVGVPVVYDAILDRSASHDRLFLVMELVRGATLRKYIDPDHPVPIGWAVAIAAQICTVLSHAHVIPVVHRDLKPDNVMVTRNGTVKVLDFGIAAILLTGVTRLTATGSPIGTSQYMAPEQIQGVQITPQCDLYALGCVLHELLGSVPVFTGDSDFELMHQHVYASPRPLRILRADVPERLEHLVLDLLEKAPELRPPSAQDVYQRLVPFLPAASADAVADLGGLPGVPDPTGPYRQPLAPRRAPASPPPVPPTVAVNLSSVANPLSASMHAAIEAAQVQAIALLEEGRFGQATEGLQAVIGRIGAAVGVDHPEVLNLRSMNAAALVIGGDFRQALPEFDYLAVAYARAVSPDADKILECRHQAAHCRAALGQNTAALRQFRDLLADVRSGAGDATPMALELRRNIGMLMLADGRVTDAVAILEPLYEDLCIINGVDAEDAQEVDDILRRLRLAEGDD